MTLAIEEQILSYYKVFQRYYKIASPLFFIKVFCHKIVLNL